MKKFQSCRKLRLESLEERALLAVTAGGFESAAALAVPTGGTTWVVNTTDDPTSWDETDSVMSLREAITRSAAGDFITFDSGITANSITLQRNLTIDHSLTIDKLDNTFTIAGSKLVTVTGPETAVTCRTAVYTNITVDSGAELIFDGIESYSSGQSVTIKVTGEGSSLSFPDLYKLETSGKITLTAVNKGLLDLSSLERISSASLSIGTEGDILLDSLETCNGLVLTTDKAESTFYMQSWNGGTLNVTNQKIDLPSLTSLTSVSLKMSGSTAELKAPLLTNIDRSKIQVSNGAKLNLSGVESYVYNVGWRDGSEGTIKVTGEGSELRLPNLWKLEAVGESFVGYYARVAMTATDKGVLDLSGLEMISTTSATVQLTITTDGDVLVDSLETCNGLVLTTDKAESTFYMQSWNGGTLNVNNQTVNLPSIRNMTRVTLNVSGSTSELNTPLLSNINNSDITVSNGAKLILDGVESYAFNSAYNDQYNKDYTKTIKVTGKGSELSLPNLQELSVVGSSGIGYYPKVVLTAVDKGILDLTGLEKITTSSGNVYLTEQTKGEILLGRLDSWTSRVHFTSDNSKYTAMTVTTLADVFDMTDDETSLREAVFLTVSGSPINFAPDLQGTLKLSKPISLVSQKDIIIDGWGKIRLDGQSACRVFDNQSGKTLTLRNLTLANGYTSGNGGNIYNSSSNLKLINCVVTGGSANNGGAIYSNGGTIDMINCTVAGNSAAALGDAVFHTGGCSANYYNTIIRGTTTYNGNNTIKLYNCLVNTPEWTGWTATDCIKYDSSLPLFKNPESGRYTLAENSQATDKGKNDYISGYQTDLAGNPRVVGEIVDIGAYEYQAGPEAEPLETPDILTGTHGHYVSYGANRHRIEWSGVANASRYELAYSTNGTSWTTVSAVGTNSVITGLSYGANVSYRVRAIGSGSYADSDWSAVKAFRVCPIDVNNDGDIAVGDNAIVLATWNYEEGEEGYLYNADINGDGMVGGGDRAFLLANWNESNDSSALAYPPSKSADAVFAEYASADLEIDLGVF